MSRIHANSTLGIRSGIVKAFRATGGVISIAGVIFAVTMLAMLASPVYTIAQIGFTIGAGLLMDTFIVRTLTVPAVAALLGARVWWPNWFLEPAGVAYFVVVPWMAETLGLLKKVAKHSGQEGPRA